MATIPVSTAPTPTAVRPHPENAVYALALAIGGLLSSAVFAENIFSRPGIGKLIVDAAHARNYPVVQGAVLTTVALFAFGAMIADLIVAWLDPRVRAAL